MSDTMRKHLEQSDWMFSGMKTFHELNESFPSLTDDKGDRKTFEQFYNDVRKVDETYNRRYLRAEYNFAQGSAAMAARWEDLSEDGGGRYHLQYRTMNDGAVRPEHQLLEGVTRPADDEFWDEYYPPNGWNCRCTVVKVLASRHPDTPEKEAWQRGAHALAKDKKGMFRFNSGKQQCTFPAYNPYTTTKCRSCSLANGKRDLAFVPRTEACAACELLYKCEDLRYHEEKTYQNGGRLMVHNLIDRNDSDFGKLMGIAEHFASEGKVVKLTPKMSRPKQFVYENIYSSLLGTPYEGKCPDLLIDGKWYEHEGFTSNNPKNAFRNMMHNGLEQSCRLIIDRPELTERWMTNNIISRLKDGQNIYEVWLRDSDGKIRLLYKKTDGQP